MNMVYKMAEEKTEINEQASTMETKFCPICGDTMHETAIRGKPYWECDDPDCGFAEPRFL